MDTINFHINYLLEGQHVAYTTALAMSSAQEINEAREGLVAEMTANKQIKRASCMIEGKWPVKLVVSTYYL